MTQSTQNTNRSPKQQQESQADRPAPQAELQEQARKEHSKLVTNTMQKINEQAYTFRKEKKKNVAENRFSHYNYPKANIGEENGCLKEKD